MNLLLNRSRSLTVVAGSMFLLLLTSGYFLADTVRGQFEEQYRERLRSSLATYGVILNYTYEGLAGSLRALARDPALLDAVSAGQPAVAARLLGRQAGADGIDAIHLADARGRILGSAGGGQVDAIGCFAAAGGIAAATRAVYLTRVEKLERDGVLQGFLCGAVLITPAGSVAGLKSILRASPFLIVGDRSYQLDAALGEVRPLAAMDDGRLGTWRSAERDFLGMTSPLAIGNAELRLGLLLPKADLVTALGRPLAAVLFSLVAMMGLALFALRSLWRQRRAEQRLTRVNQQALVTLSSIGDSVVTTDAQGVIDFANRAVQRLLGMPLERVRGRRWHEVLQLASDSDEPLGDPVGDCIAAGTAVCSPGIVMLGVGHHRIAVKYTVAPIVVDGLVSGAVIVLHDVSNEHALHQQLAWKAGHDELTGLPNRRSFHQAVAGELDRLRQSGGQSVLLFLDLDRFKSVNDRGGHDAGDRLLQQVCRLFAENLRSDDMLARLGGDEFGVLLRGAGREQARCIAERLVQRLAGWRFEYGGKVFSIGVSVGLLELDGASGSLEQVLKQADSACYDAKAAGRGCVRLAATA